MVGRPFAAQHSEPKFLVVFPGFHSRGFFKAKSISQISYPQLGCLHLGSPSGDLSCADLSLLLVSNISFVRERCETKTAPANAHRGAKDRRQDAFGYGAKSHQNPAKKLRKASIKIVVKVKTRFLHSKITQQSEVNTSCFNDKTVRENDGKIRPEEGHSKAENHQSFLVTTIMLENRTFVFANGKIAGNL